jgi:outer membrane protein OmpA-like peptidoglycan-associated protein
MKFNIRDFFWPSYVDLLTSLFIIMLVLFVLSYKLLSDSKKATEDELKKINEIQRISENLPKKFFEYQNEFKRWTLIQPTQFATGSDVIPSNDFSYLKEVGDSLVQMLNNLQKKYGDSLKYLIIIEGMSSKIGYDSDPNNLSYRRAKSLVNFWKRNNIIFNPQVCEVIISGSGIEGIGRYEYDPPNFNQERKNQRILIQIVPKLSKFKDHTGVDYH